ERASSSRGRRRAHPVAPSAVRRSAPLRGGADPGAAVADGSGDHL
ncbi:MAG: hypothetical protein AVDCRST_MAG90-1870, partial [uncultured Microvirga sp.]